MLAAHMRLLADDAADVKRQIELLLQQNAALVEQVRQQATTIDKLNRRVGDIEQAAEQRRDAGDSKASAPEKIRYIPSV